MSLKYQNFCGEEVGNNLVDRKANSFHYHLFFPSEAWGYCIYEVLANILLGHGILELSLLIIYLAYDSAL